VDTVLTGRTAYELFEEILVPVKYPTLTDPFVSTNTVISGGNANLFEIGCVLDDFVVVSNYDRGCINPQYIATSDKRSSGVKGYCFTGPGFPNFYDPENANIYSKIVSPYTVINGGQTWSTKACYCSGVQPYDNKDNTYGTPLTEGFTTTKEASISGILPWYWGQSLSSTPTPQCIVDYGCSVGSGGKCVNNVTNTPIQIIYNGNGSAYLWFALPSCSAIKTCYKVNNFNHGTIGGLGNLWVDSYTGDLFSAEDCWDGCEYDIYVTAGVAGTDFNVPMCIY